MLPPSSSIWFSSLLLFIDLVLFSSIVHRSVFPSLVVDLVLFSSLLVSSHAPSLVVDLILFSSVVYRSVFPSLVIDLVLFSSLLVANLLPIVTPRFLKSPTVHSGAKSELKRRSYDQNSVRYPLGYCDSDCDSVTIAVTIARAGDCASDCAIGTIAWHYSLRVFGSFDLRIQVFFKGALVGGKSRFSLNLARHGVPLSPFRKLVHHLARNRHRAPCWGFVSCKLFEELSIRFTREEVAW
ncbi:hypothetical protein L6452_09792 [Arctium lappa]|uniref:Uncharacterized protein n=1 Tax=Arctium lappa TaxID=4217 RepID=A0ACB9DL00_ARCLA|nr:hypothetical protein L6452_09792 [Arctium lappa]